MKQLEQQNTSTPVKGPASSGDGGEGGDEGARVLREKVCRVNYRSWHGKRDLASCESGDKLLSGSLSISGIFIG